MESYAIGFVLLLALAETMALHIVISPEEASKIMKRDDEFSRGLAGFIEETAKGAKHADLTKREKVNQLKSMIKIALDEVDGKTYGDRIEKDAKKAKDAPPALPLDIITKKDVRELKHMVNSLLDEDALKAKRQGWVHYGKKEADDRKRQLEKEVKEMEYSQKRLEKIYQKVKQLVNAVKSAKLKDAPAADPKDKVVISDSGDVGSKMLARIKQLIAERKANDHRKIEKEIVDKLNALTKKLAEKTNPYPDVGELSLNAIRGIVSEKGKKESSAEVKSHPKSKARDEISLDSLTDQVNDLLRKLKPKSGRDGDRKSDEEIKTDVAVESEERPQKDRYRSVHGKTRKELIANLIKTYDALTKGSDEKSDAVEEELEVLSSKAAKRSANNGKVSKETAEAIKGFDITDVGKRNIPHPK